MSTPRPVPVDAPPGTALGRQLLVDLYGCDRERLDDEAYVRQHLMAAAEHAGATVIDAHFHSFTPCGVTGTVSIQESHLSIHTWPEHSYAAVDIFTCGDSVDPWRAYEALKAAFLADRGSAVEVHRGRPDVL
ncbi:MAG: adenosylmethionine decarboxylase [bacterium]|nr:adenosylmethionine decarboxylase [bacterium]